jgi:hypothetical protein
MKQILIRSIDLYDTLKWNDFLLRSLFYSVLLNEMSHLLPHLNGPLKAHNFLFLSVSNEMTC